MQNRVGGKTDCSQSPLYGTTRHPVPWVGSRRKRSWMSEAVLFLLRAVPRLQNTKTLHLLRKKAVQLLTQVSELVSGIIPFLLGSESGLVRVQCGPLGAHCPSRNFVAILI